MTKKFNCGQSIYNGLTAGDVVAPAQVVLLSRELTRVRLVFNI